MDLPELNVMQVAPFPYDLLYLVENCTYRPGWTVLLDPDMDRDYVDGQLVGHGLTLVIKTKGYDSYHPDRGDNYSVYHYFIVPAATYTRSAWMRWLFEQFLKVEQHEAMEFFRLGDNHPFAPNHGPGEDPYIIHEPTTDEARRTSFRGVIKDA